MFFSAKDMGIDLGTANTLIYLKDSGIILNEPSVIAIDKRRNITLAAGDEAKAMIGKAPANILVVRPLQDGVISDFDRTSDMLRAFIEKAVTANRIKNFRVVVGVPSGVTEVEKRAVEEVVRQMGASEVYILEEPMAAAIGAGLDVDSSFAYSWAMEHGMGVAASDGTHALLDPAACSYSARRLDDGLVELTVRWGLAEPSADVSVGAVTLGVPASTDVREVRVDGATQIGRASCRERV